MMTAMRAMPSRILPQTRSPVDRCTSRGGNKEREGAALAGKVLARERAGKGRGGPEEGARMAAVIWSATEPRENW
jgi:hypothetical protein